MQLATIIAHFTIDLWLKMRDICNLHKNHHIQSFDAEIKYVLCSRVDFDHLYLDIDIYKL